MKQFDLPLKVFFVIFLTALGGALLLDQDFSHALKTGMRFGAAGLVGFLIFAVILSKMYKPFPVCRTGRCTDAAYDYSVVESADSHLPAGTDGVSLKCRCGQEYLYQKKKFFVVGDDGELIPYKRLKGIKWVDM